MIAINNKKDCCGCSACAQICPKNCIEMKPDAEGFLYPTVNQTLCVNCGACDRACPILNRKIKENVKPTTFVAYHKSEDIRKESSSGGLFTPLAEAILKDGGVVVGAAFNPTFTVHHVMIDSLEDLSQLRGSKYVQSRSEDTFSQTKQALKDGRKVLYTGTACQIAGLKVFLGKEYENLYTVDVLCHGVPSPLLWDKYLREQENAHGAAVRRTFFRHKKYGWKTYAVSLEFTNETAYECVFFKDAFMQMFLKNICLRPSCYSCRFKEMDRPSDITLGDCWGVDKHMPEMDDDRGTSVVLVHSEKGQQLMQAIEDQLVICKSELDTALPPSADSRKSVPMHPNRNVFFKMLAKGKSIKRLVRLIQPSFMQRFIRKIKNIIKKIIKR